eukprot:CAMPEP_0204589476 /NCGR_PEP_ID=MMETSP0661-20131031/49222_1 /ASSEMBLY_ACC=CAM_ASM_000606 /TAXON_ID=109239 /ORGANISM="Alexandrium margalefi, Strain AMGDE01CS-322" /LENGTH=45 /DNA_ID= /DNA_START= /DNA_END= /DNA_ORIENTATION=
MIIPGVPSARAGCKTCGLGQKVRQPLHGIPRREVLGGARIEHASV